MKSVNVLILGLLFVSYPLFGSNINVVPKPQSILMLKGKLNIAANIKIIPDDKINNEIITNQITNEFNNDVITASNNNVKSIININLKVIEQTSDFLKYFNIDDSESINKLEDEGYVLKIFDEQISIAAKTERGVFYGVQTLKQIIRSNKELNQIQNCLIIDYPEMKFRSISDDISRGPIPTMDFMKYQIRRASELKYNHWMHYVEHVVKTKKHGAFAPSDGNLTIDDIKELSEYAKKYYITFFGNFQSFGHFQAINSYPQYQHLVEMGTILSPALDESYQFLDEIFEELIPAFDAPFFSINCDETFDLGKGKSKHLVDSLGIAKVFTNHILRIKKLVDKHNVKTLVWADEPLKYSKILDALPKDIILGTWTYDAKDNFDEFINPIKERGFDFMVCPGVLNSTRVMPNFNTSLKNIRNFDRDAIKTGAMGMLNCVWDDGGFALFNRDWYGVAYGAEQSWNNNEEKVEDFNTRLNLGVYGDKSNSLTDAIFKLLELADLPPTDNMNEKILWTNTIPERFNQLSISLNDWDEIKKISQEAKVLVLGRVNSLYDDDFEVYLFTAELYEFIADLRINIVEASDCYREAMLNQNDRILSRKYLLNAANKIDELLIRQNKILYDYKRFWLLENKTYALDRVTDKMEDQYLKLEKLSNRLLESLSDFDKRLYLKPPDDIGLDIKKITGQYFRGWLVLNPLPIEENGSSDYLAEMSGELNAAPKVTNEFYYKNKKYRWKRIYSDYLDIVNLKELFPEQNQNSVIYAYGEVSAETDMIVKAAIGADDRADVILNGTKILTIDKKRSLIPDEIELELNLKKGKNDLMIKIFQTDGEWGFSFQLPNNKFKGSKNRYKISN